MGRFFSQMDRPILIPPPSSSSTHIRLQRSLDVQEQKTRIAFLENEQAELETEIRMLRNQVTKAGEEQSMDDLAEKVRIEVTDTLTEKKKKYQGNNGGGYND